MIFAELNTSETLWLPLYTLNDKFYETPGYFTLGMLQLAIYLMTAYTIIRTCNIFMTRKVFHDNLNYLMAWFLFQWFEAILAKLVILPYQFGLVGVGMERQKTFYSWWSDKPENIVKIQSVNEILPLYVACGFLWHYIYSMIFAIVIVGFERICATWYSEDYESVPRRHIPIILIAVTNIITIPYAYHITRNHISFLIAYGQCFVNAGIVFFGYLMIWRINVVMRNRMLNDKNGQYSLGRKFQIDENIRSFLIARKFVMVAIIYLSVSLILLFFIVFGLVEEYQSLFVYILDNAIFSAALVLCVTLLFCSPQWKRAFIRGLPFMKDFKSSRVSQFELQTPPIKHNESEVYFEQLNNIWV